MKQSFHNSIWRHRDLRIVAPARALSFLGDEIAVFALMLRLHDSGHGEWGVAALLLATAIPTVIAAPWAGRLADRLDSRLLLVSCALLQAAACVVLAFTSSLVLTLALVATLQCFQAAAGPGWQALVPSIVGSEDVARTMGMLQSLNFLAGVGGPALTGWLVATHGSSAALLVDAATFAALAVAALLLRTRRGGVIGVADAKPRALDGLRWLRMDRVLWPLLGAMVVFVVAGESGNVVEVFLVRDVLGASPTAFGMLGALFAVGAATGAFAAGRVRGPAHQVDALLLSCGVVAVATLLAGVITNLLPWAVVWVFCGLAVGGINAMTGALVATRAPAEARGQVFSTVTATTRAASLVATALGGIAGALLGPQAVFVIAGSGCLLTTAVSSRLLRQAVRRPAIASALLEPQPA